MNTSNETEGKTFDRGTTVRSRGARTQKEPRAPTDDDEGPNPKYTVEPVNVDMLRDVASRRCKVARRRCVNVFIMSSDVWRRITGVASVVSLYAGVSRAHSQISALKRDDSVGAGRF